MSAAIDAGLRAVLDAAGRWIAAAGMRPTPLPAALARMSGALAGARLELTTQRHVGGGLAALTLAAIADADGLLRSATLIGLPDPATLGPVLGVDLIAFGGALSLVAVDLSPTDLAHWHTRAAAELEALHLVVEGRVTPRKWPGFAEAVFSRRALIAGVKRGAEAPVLAAVAEFVAALAPVFPAATRPPDAVRVAAAAERARAWRRAELANRREHDALARIFGEANAAAYLEQLFGDP